MQRCAPIESPPGLAADLPPASRYDLVIQDPPSLARREGDREGAVAACVRAACCWHPARRTSAHVGADKFLGAILAGLRRTGRRFEELERTLQPPDHPATVLEAHNLKGIHLRNKSSTSPRCCVPESASGPLLPPHDRVPVCGEGHAHAFAFKVKLDEVRRTIRTNWTNMMSMRKWMLCAGAVASMNSQFALRSDASLFKIDFGHLENERIPLDVDGNPLPVPALLTDWTVIPTWTFADPNANVLPDTANAKGTANADGTQVTWKLIDASSNPKTNVTLTILDNTALAESLSPDSPPFMVGQTANNPTKEGINVMYDGVDVPAIVKDDYLYRLPDAAGSESLMRIANLEPGTYNVTVFEGRTTDGGRYGKIWVDDIKGAKEPASENTGNYAGQDASGAKLYKGQPRTTTVTLKAGEYLWFAEVEDNSGGISGMIIRSVDPVDSQGLFKVDFGQLENERVPNGADGTPQLDPDGNEVGAPLPLKGWNVIPTWTYADPNANAKDGTASVKGTANAAGTEVTWKLTDFSKDANKDVSMTIMDNAALAESLAPDGPQYMQGGTANNPTKEGISVLYDGVLVPAAVKDDYIYRLPDAAGSETLLRFAGLKPGKYNVTVFEGRTTDSGRYGKIWADDIKGAKEPASENTGNYAGNDGTGALPLGQARTVTVDIKAGEYLWFAEIEDNSGGVSGLIIRGLPVVAPSVQLVSSSTVNGTYTVVSDAKVDAIAKTITTPAKDTARFFRVQGSNVIVGSSVAAGQLAIKYQ